MKKDHILLLAAVVLLFVSACKTVNGPNAQPGSITGNVMLFDTSGREIPRPYHDITVWLENTNYKTQADSLGLWTISNIPAGLYNVMVSKTGFGSFKSANNVIEGPGTDGTNLQLGRIPTATTMIDSLSGTVDGLNVYVKTRSRMVALFVDTDPSIPLGDVHKCLTIMDANPSADGKLTIPSYTLNRSGIFPGMNIYCKAAACAPTPSVYFDTKYFAYRVASPGPVSNTITLTIQ